MPPTHPALQHLWWLTGCLFCRLCFRCVWECMFYCVYEYVCMGVFVQTVLWVSPMLGDKPLKTCSVWCACIPLVASSGVWVSGFACVFVMKRWMLSDISHWQSGIMPKTVIRSRHYEQARLITHTLLTRSQLVLSVWWSCSSAVVYWCFAVHTSPWRTSSQIEQRLHVYFRHSDLKTFCVPNGKMWCSKAWNKYLYRNHMRHIKLTHRDASN